MIRYDRDSTLGALYVCGGILKYFLTFPGSQLREAKTGEIKTLLLMPVKTLLIMD